MTIDDITIPELEDAPDLIVRRPWTVEEEAILRKYYGRKSLHDIAKYLDRTDYAVKFKAQSLGLSVFRSE